MHVEEAFATRRFSSSVTAHSTNPTVRPLWVATLGRPDASGTGEGDTGPQNPLPVFRSCLFAEPARRLTSSLRSGSVGFTRIAPFMTQTCVFFHRVWFRVPAPRFPVSWQRSSKGPLFQRTRTGAWRDLLFAWSSGRRTG